MTTNEQALTIGRDLATAYVPRALQTALPTARSMHYLLPGIISEVGEVYGKVAKLFRDRPPFTDYQGAVVKEWGDVCWMVGVALNRVGAISGTGVVERDPLPLVDPLPLAEGGGVIHGTLSPLMDRALALEALYFTDGMDTTEQRDQMTKHLWELWFLLFQWSYPVTGEGLGAVLDKNLEKLAARAHSNTISGSGDER